MCITVSSLPKKENDGFEYYQFSTLVLLSHICVMKFSISCQLFKVKKERAGSLRYPLFLAAFQARSGVAGWWGQGSGGTGEERILTEQSFLAAASALLG